MPRQRVASSTPLAWVEALVCNSKLTKAISGDCRVDPHGTLADGNTLLSIQIKLPAPVLLEATPTPVYNASIVFRL